MKVKLFVLFGFCIVLFVNLSAGQTASPIRGGVSRLLRFPAIHGDRIVFTYAGDLYTVPSSGGTARKLTSHGGFEMFARFSPDGKTLAFTGQYDGNTEVYVMPADGGVPNRLTFTATLGRDDVSDRMGPNNIVMTWKHDNRHIVFRSRMREHNDFIARLFAVSMDGDIPEQVPVPRGGFCSFSPDDSKMAYNRVFREFRTWKRYRGGMADDIWIFDFAGKKIENITSNPACDIIPMWHQSRIYFLSDRDESRRMNLFVYDLISKETRPLTRFSDFDIKFPSLGESAIVFENGGYIYRFDLASEECRKVPILILDDELGGRGGIRNVSGSVTHYEISPDGKRALFGARGDVFTVPAKNGSVRNLTATPGVHERNSKWSPDGRWIAYISDATGEDEIYVAPQDGNGAVRQLTSGSDTYKYQIFWSPDSKKILWADKKLRLRYALVDTGEVREIAQARLFEFSQYVWSPDSLWIAYIKPEEEVMNRVYLHSLDQKASFEVTDGWYTASEPAFSSDGKYLFFVSNRDFDPVYSLTEYNHAYRDMSRIYLVTLAKITESPFRPKSDEVAIGKGETKAGEKGKTAGAKKDVAENIGVRIDPEEIGERVVSLPIQASVYSSLGSVGESLYYLRSGSQDKKAQLMMFDLGQQKETPLGEINGYEISADRKKMLVSRDGSYAIIDLPKGKIDLSETLNLGTMEVKLDRKSEWRQIFNECWRQMRDFFYVPNMHGVDWPGVRRKYEALVPFVNHRADLTFILGEMIGELNAGHTYVGGGDMPKPARIPTGLLGAELERDPASRFYRIKRVLKGQNWEKAVRSPLTEVGVRAGEGDYILAVDGKSTARTPNIYESLLNTVGRQVRLKVNSRPVEAGSWETVVLPIGDEARLYYFNWVEENIRKVGQATGGKVGYIHIPDMGEPGLNEFVKHFFPQLRKQALIFDVRGNGGGSVSPMIIDRLRREIAMVSVARNTVQSPDPNEAVLGPMVCLLDEFSASDGDIFPYRFRKANLGKLVGKRSWGGVVGIRGTLPLLDGGFLFKPEFATYGAEGQGWIIEGHGVDPDIVVDNDPAREFAGIDDQLNKAIEVILEELKTKGKKLPPVPAGPDKL